MGSQESDSTLLPGEAPPPLPKALVETLHPALERPEGLGQTLERGIFRGFGVDHGGELVRRTGTQKTARVSLQIPQQVSQPPVRYEFTLSQKATGVSGSVAAELITLAAAPWQMLESLWEEMSFRRRRSLEEADLASREGQYAMRLLLDAVFASLVRPLAQGTFYLPASRTGIMNTHQVLVSALVRGATRAGIEPTPRVDRLAGVIADFLDQLVRMPSDRRAGLPVRHRRPRRGRRGELDKLAEGLEDRVLGGVVGEVRSETDYPIFTYQPQGWQDALPLMRTSSMVSELAPVVLYLRHLVEPGDVLIIEEPESHLHPEMQTALARELARVVNADVRIILTTHSEWFVEQISNLVRLSELPTASRAEISGDEVALDHDQVGVWRFKESKRPKGSVVSEVELDDDTGLFPAGYDAVSEALYNESAQTFNRLQGVRAK